MSESFDALFRNLDKRSQNRPRAGSFKADARMQMATRMQLVPRGRYAVNLRRHPGDAVEIQVRKCVDVTTDRDVRKWCWPQTILVVMRASDDPAQVLWAMRQAEIVPNPKIILVQLNDETDAPPVSSSRLHVVPPRFSGGSPFPPANSGCSLMWTEIIRRAFVLRGISLRELPDIVRAFRIGRVIATTERGHGWSQRMSLEASLIAKLGVPVWILGRGMALSLQAPSAPRRILVPVSLTIDVSSLMRFAYGLAQAYDAVISVLHVIEHSTGEVPDLTRIHLSPRSFLSPAAREMCSAACSIEVAVRQGDPATQILEYNTHKHHDVVLLPCHSERAERGDRTSTVFARLCSEMRCPIVVLGSAMDGKGQAKPIRAHATEDHDLKPIIVSEACREVR